MDDIKIASDYSRTTQELSAIADAIRELKARQRKFKRVLVQHRKLERTIGSLVVQHTEERY